MNDMQRKQTRLRIYIGENDRIGKKVAYRAIFEYLHHHKLAGATVFRGISGFGAASRLHDTHLLAISEDLPILIETIDTEAKIRQILPELEVLLPEGLITLEEVEVIRCHTKTQNKES